MVINGSQQYISDLNEVPRDSKLYIYTWGDTAPSNAPSITYATCLSWCFGSSSAVSRGIQIAVGSNDKAYIRTSDWHEWKSWKKISLS